MKIEVYLDKSYTEKKILSKNRLKNCQLKRWQL